MTRTARKTLLAVVLAVAVLAVTGVAAGGAVQDMTRDAELTIEQPHYVDESVSVEPGPNTTTYVARGEVLEIRPTNFNATDVVDFSVDAEGASITFDRAARQFKLRVPVSGSYRVRWTVAESVSPNGTNRTEIRNVNYAATVQVRQVEYAHVNQSAYEQTRQDAQNWTTFAGELKQLFPGQTVEESAQRALNAAQFLANPFSALSGQFTSAITILLLTNGGRLLLALLLGVPLLIVAPIIWQYRRYKQRLPDIEDLDTKAMQLEAQQKKRQLVNATPYDLPMDNRTADKLAEKVGENLWLITDRIHRLFDGLVTKRVFAQAMGYHDNAVRFRRSDGEVTDLEVIDAEDIPDEDDEDAATDGGLAWEYQHLSSPTDDVLAALSYEQLDRRALTDDVPLGEIDAPLHSEDIGADILDATDVSVPEDFESREAFAEALGEVTKFVLAHEYTDEEGVIREEQSALNLLSLLTTVTAERYDVPTMRFFRDMLSYLTARLDGNDELNEAASESGYEDLSVSDEVFGDGD